MNGLSCNHWRLSRRERIDEALREGARPLIVACGEQQHSAAIKAGLEARRG